jgi:hypothetical protein
LALTLATDGLYAPVKRRAAFCYADVPALALAAGTIAYPNVPVMPGNIFIAALTGDAAIAEGFCFVEEYVDGNEQL